MEKRIGIRTKEGETIYFEDHEYICFEAQGTDVYAYVEYKEGDKRYEKLTLIPTDYNKKEGWLRFLETRHLKCIEKLADLRGFGRSHRKWVINIKRVYSSNYTSVKLHNAPLDSIPIGPKY